MKVWFGKGIRPDTGGLGPRGGGGGKFCCGTGGGGMLDLMVVAGDERD